MNCSDSRIYLAAYLDDELDVSDHLRVQQHLSDCARCRQRQQQQLALRTALRDPELVAEPSAALEARIATALRQAAAGETKTPKSSSQWMPALAALLVVAVGAALLWNRGAGSDRLLADAVVASHIRSLQPGHLVDVPSSDHHTVKPWFQGKLDFSPPVPDVSQLGWVLIGGRLDYVGERPVAALVYRRRLHDVNVFLWPNHDSSAGGIAQQTSQGYQMVHWNGAGATYWLVSDLNAAELLELAQAMRTGN